MNCNDCSQLKVHKDCIDDLECKRRYYLNENHAVTERAEKAKAELAEVKRERDYLRDKSAGKILNLEEELEELSEENQQLEADNIGYRDQIDLLTKDAIDRELASAGIIENLRAEYERVAIGNLELAEKMGKAEADLDHWRKRAIHCEERRARQKARSQ